MHRRDRRRTHGGRNVANHPLISTTSHLCHERWEGCMPSRDYPS
jgi:hypothetical protein